LTTAAVRTHLLKSLSAAAALAARARIDSHNAVRRRVAANNKQADAALGDDRVGHGCPAEEGGGVQASALSGFTLARQLDFVACSNWQITRFGSFGDLSASAAARYIAIEGLQRSATRGGIPRSCQPAQSWLARGLDLICRRVRKQLCLKGDRRCSEPSVIHCCSF
jgi:hypothetical protein